MVWIELFLNTKFYINHLILESNKSSFSFLLSNKTFDNECERLVQFEAIHNCWGCLRYLSQLTV